MRVLSLAVLASLLLLPAASAADTAVLAFATPASATLTVDSLRPQSESDYFRQVADNFGDRDGTVSEAEAVQAAALARPIVEKEIQRQLKGGNLTLDGKAPVTTEIKRIAFENLTGPVQQPIPVKAHAEVSILFDGAGGPDHTLFERVRPRPGQSFNITIVPPPGYEAAKTSYTVASTTEGSTILLFVPQTDTATAVPSPAGGLGLALWAVGLALAANRRRQPRQP